MQHSIERESYEPSSSRVASKIFQQKDLEASEGGRQEPPGGEITKGISRRRSKRMKRAVLEKIRQHPDGVDVHEILTKS